MSIAEPDVAFMLYTAGRILDGARLYRDVVDLNPPLIFAFNLPIAWLARAGGVSGLVLGSLVTALLVGSILLFVRRLLKRYLLVGRTVDRRYVLLALCFILFPLAREDFGQREHLVLALLLPGLVIAIARDRGERVGWKDATVSGVLSGLGLALKPYFVLAWFGVEVWRRLRGRSARWRFTPELAAVLGTTGAYALAAVELTPDYFKLVAVLAPAYISYLRVPPLNLVLFGPGAALTLFALLAAVALRSGREADARAALAVAMVGCFLVAILQQKGWRYHFYPSFGLATLLLALVAAQSWRPLGPSGQLYVQLSRWLLAALGAVVVASSARDAMGGDRIARHRRADFLDLVETVRAHAGGMPIGILSYHMGSAFPLVNYANVALASRFPCLWILQATYGTALRGEQPVRYHTTVEMPRAERMLNAAVAADLLDARPALLLILRALPDEPRFGFQRLNYVAYFSREPSLGRLFTEYQLIATKGQYDVYQRLAPGIARTGPPPSVVVPPVAGRPGGLPEARPSPIDPALLFGIAVFLLVGVASLLRERHRRRPCA